MANNPSEMILVGWDKSSYTAQVQHKDKMWVVSVDQEIVEPLIAIKAIKDAVLAEVQKQADEQAVEDAKVSLDQYYGLDISTGVPI